MLSQSFFLFYSYFTYLLVVVGCEGKSSAKRCLQRLETSARMGGLLQVTYEASALHAALCSQNDIVALTDHDESSENDNTTSVMHHVITNDGNAGLAHQLRLLSISRRQHYPNVEKRICKAAIL